ncbi:4a-hydroxytetrahydrobiopterin dehydratase [Xylanimonas oleitrophica]|uniref:Putative pterin-4-alpha-carbinolamine dehydratase n=1 Tax=Xylanimonas oleitrophica TaxID=2607479 RepID=A0A2W5WP93_9MICO|nr:4a-hydroxytetrahydrobiopterin dehydratase [Xylanimonas oleitrophica]PZR52802.1 4a-hydroxytetrahydrobiopterin dehydratase [Xylanimonas oleitrophica]
MVEQITAQQFLESHGVDGWVTNDSGVATAIFTSGDRATGERLAERIGELGAAANHDADVEVAQDRVTVRLSTHEVGGLSQRDVDLARQITGAARELGIEVDRSL